ncbi:MAG: hypothetical protein A2081_05395 [Elusimicrobia bacterium GWC2_61_19]|nr:MAG: hypothetical protein A2081_05395 [Elusimicrobia bacterium GWC2_61_19]
MKARGLTVNDLKHAIDKYNTFGYRLFMDTPAFRGLLALRNRSFRKKLLLVNLRDSAMSAHLERAFARAAAAHGATALDVFHSFEHDYGLGPAGGAAGFRIKYSGMDNLRAFSGLTAYSAVILVDLPYRDEDLPAWLWFALRAPGAKHFIANDILMPPGHIFAMDVAEKLGVFSAFSTAALVDQHSRAQWGRFGRPGRFLERPLAVDCDYYAPAGAGAGDYVFSFGRADRDYAPLMAAARTFPKGLKLKICTDLPVRVPKILAGRVAIITQPVGPEKMKEFIAGAALVALPVRPTAPNPGAGLTAALLSMAMGKLTITCGDPVVTRYLSDGKDSFLYRGLTPAALSACVRRSLALTPAGRAAVSAAARRTVLRRFDMNAFAAGHLATLLGHEPAERRRDSIVKLHL